MVDCERLGSQLLLGLSIPFSNVAPNFANQQARVLDVGNVWSDFHWVNVFAL